MAIIGSLSLKNTVVLNTAPLTYQVWLNLVCSSTTTEITTLDIYDGGILTDTINVPATSPPTTVLGNAVTPHMVGVTASATGWHTYEVDVKNSSSENRRFSVTVYLDLASPVVNDFSIKKISKSGGDYVIEFNMDIDDDSGVSKIILHNDTNGDSSVQTIPVGLTNFVGSQSIRMPDIPFNNNTTKDFYITVHDYSGNSVDSALLPIYFTDIPPSITSFNITSISQTATHYQIDTQLVASFSALQHLTKYSVTFENPSPTWETLISAVSPTTINKTLLVPKSEPAGIKTLTAYVEDNYLNQSVPRTVSFDLDKLQPLGNINMDFAEKIGSNYYANLHFTATDAGKIAAYSYSLVGATALTTWNPVSPPTTNFSLKKTLNLGSSGSSMIYVKYRDFSGNESPVYQEFMEIDTSPPSCSFSFSHGEQRPDLDYEAYFDLIGQDMNPGGAIKFIRFFGENANTGNLVSGHSNSWVQVTETQNLIEQRPLIIPQTEHEDPIDFYYQVRDRFGNESTPVNVQRVQFDKTSPSINTFSYVDVTKGATDYRVFAEFEAVDNFGIAAFRYAFDNITLAPWIATTSTTHLIQQIYLDVPVTDLNVPKDFIVQVRDVFGNESLDSILPVNVNDVPPSGSISFAGGALTATDYIMTFQLDAMDPDPTDNVYWYSLEVDDVTIVNWKPFTNANSVVSETVNLLLPRTSTGRHDFYVRYADKYKNESPVYNIQYDLDAITTVGGIDLVNVEKSGTSYAANVALFAVDNRKVQSYIIEDSITTTPTEYAIVPPVQIFDENVLIPIGSSAGPRWVKVQYKDNFDNLSNTYQIDFDLDTTSPNANIYFASSTSNLTHMFFNFDLNMKDNHQLYEYKFWSSEVIEPTDWTRIPRANTVSINTTFPIPKGTPNPGFFWKVKDFFGNEFYDTEIKTITTMPPSSKMEISSIVYNLGGINVGVDYDLLAWPGSTVDKFLIDVNMGMDSFEIDVLPNQVNPTGTFHYNFPLSTTFARFDCFGTSDYGYQNVVANTVTTLFDSVVPEVTNATFLGSYGDMADYILQFRVAGHDTGSGLRKVRVSIPTTPDVVYAMPLTNIMDEIINVRVPGTFAGNMVSPTIYLEDLLGNQSVGNTIPNIFLDGSGPTIANLVVNFNKTYPSSSFPAPPIGSNTRFIDVTWDASDFSEITHYYYSRNVNETFNHLTWTPVTPNRKRVDVTETVNLDTIGIPEGLGGFFVHTKDRFDNISTAGVSFEYDKTPPTINTTFLNRIERANVAGVDHFIVPYQVTYNDNYSSIVKRVDWHQIGGVWSSANVVNFSPDVITNTSIERYAIPVGYHGFTKINTAVMDRFENLSANDSFQVFLEDQPPVINYTTLNAGAAYTTNKNVLLRVDMLDDRGVTEYHVSNTANVFWDSPGWATIPLSPATSITSTFSIDLEAIGFDQGTCNVYTHIKDFCQNVSNNISTIIYDYEPPEVVSFKIEKFVRTPSTFDITLNAICYDVTSGLHDYYISQSSIETTFNPVPGAPVIGNSVNTTTFSEIQQVSVRDAGWKFFYFEAHDAAGNLSVKANTKMYIDTLAPIASVFEPIDGPTKYYLSPANSTFSYQVADDFALAALGWQFDGATPTMFATYPAPIGLNPGTLTDIGTFNAVNLGTLTDGEHTINLVIVDQMGNRVAVPYDFYFDGTAPTINRFEIIETIATSTPGTDFKVEFAVDIEDYAGISHYNILDNGILAATVPVNKKDLDATPTIDVSLSTLFGPSGMDMQFMVLEDMYGLKRTDCLVIVSGYDGSGASQDKIIALASAKSGVPISKLTFTHLGQSSGPTDPTDINFWHRDSVKHRAGTDTLQSQIASWDPAAVTVTPPYDIIQIDSVLDEHTESEFAVYLRNHPTTTIFTDPINTTNEWSNVFLSPMYADASSTSEVHVFTLQAFDYAGNMQEQEIHQLFHDGTALTISNYLVGGAASVLRTSYTSETFTADLESPVKIIQTALTIQDSSVVDFYSPFWEDIATPSQIISFTDTKSINQFALTDTSPNNKVYLHIKDACGHMTSSVVDVNVAVNNPAIKNVSSPINLTREGHYYVGTITFDVETKP